MNANLADYHVPVNSDLGEIDVSAIDNPDPQLDSLGARGIGEIGITVQVPQSRTQSSMLRESESANHRLLMTRLFESGRVKDFKETFMAKCEVCGNQYDKSFEVMAEGARHTFDSFECAIQALAPKCEHCQCKIIGHGTEVAGRMFCCAHCAQSATPAEVRDCAL